MMNYLVEEEINDINKFHLSICILLRTIRFK